MKQEVISTRLRQREVTDTIFFFLKDGKLTTPFSIYKEGTTPNPEPAAKKATAEE